MTRSLRRNALGPVVCCLLVACGPGSSEDDGAGEESTAPTESGTDPVSTDGPVATGSTSGTSPAAPSDGPAAETDDDSATPDDVEQDPTSPDTAIEPGTPEVLLSDLDFPGRFVVHDDSLYIANRPHLRDRSLLDELLVVPVGAAPGQVRVLFEAPSIEGVAVVGQRVWIASLVAQAFMAFDLTTGEAISTASVGNGLYPLQLAGDGDALFLGVAPGQIFYVEPNVPQSLTDPLWQDPNGGSTQWMLANQGTVYAVLERRSDDDRVLGQLVAIEAATKAVTLLTDGADRLGGMALAGGDLLFANYSQGQLLHIPAGSTQSELVASVPRAWGVTVDGSSAYVSTQPDFCLDGPDGDVRRVSLDSGASELLAEGQNCPSMLTAQADGLYWLNNGEVDYAPDTGVLSHRTGSLMRLAR